MSKRSRMGDQLTGGTRDVNPQLLSASTLTQSAADTTTTLEVALPVTRIPQSAKATIIEILKIFVTLTALPASASATEVIDTQTLAVSTASGGTTALAFNDPRVIALVNTGSRSAFTAAGTYFSLIGNNVHEVNLTDGAGHGLLIATDSIFLQLASSGTGNANSAYVKILYRYKSVGIMEFVGIAQQQQ